MVKNVRIIALISQSDVARKLDQQLILTLMSYSFPSYVFVFYFFSNKAAKAPNDCIWMNKST